jgi:YHS domain-containing protein
VRINKMLVSIASKSFFVAVLTVALSAGQNDEKIKTDSTKTIVHSMDLKPQTTCPVMGEAINKKEYVDYNGKRIYVCCPMCIEKVKKDPETYIKKLESKGQSVETIVDQNKDLKAYSSMKKMDMKDNKMSLDTGKSISETGYWTCSMHPEIHKTEPGNCPICSMKLVFKNVAKDTTQMKSMNHNKMKM